MVLSWDMGPHRLCPAVYTGLKNIQPGWFHQVRPTGNCSRLVWQKSKRRQELQQVPCPAGPVSAAPCPAFISLWFFSALNSFFSVGPPCPPFPCSFLYILIFLVCKSGLVSAPQDNLSGLQTRFSLPLKTTVMVVICPQGRHHPTLMDACKGIPDWWVRENFFNLRRGMLMDIIMLESSGHNFIFGPYAALLLSVCLFFVLSIVFVTIIPTSSSPQAIVPMCLTSILLSMCSLAHCLLLFGVRIFVTYRNDFYWAFYLFLTLFNQK